MPKETLQGILTNLFGDQASAEREIIKIVKKSYDEAYIVYSFVIHFFFYFLLILPPFFSLGLDILPFLVCISMIRTALLFQKYLALKTLRHVIFLAGLATDALFYTCIGYTLHSFPSLENFYLSNAYLMVCSILIILYSMRLERLSCAVASFYFTVFHIIYIFFIPDILVEQTTLFSRIFPILTFIGAGLVGSVFIVNKQKSISDLYKLSEERRFMKQELALAKKVQDALFPRGTKIPGLKYKYYRKNPNVIGGDFFDFVQLREGNVGVFLTDVAGHGISSAMVASIMKVLVSTIPYRFKLSPSKLLDYLDEKLVNDLNRYHASAIYLFFDFLEKKVQIGNAGHPYMIHAPKGKDFYEIETDGAILGFNIRRPIAIEKSIHFSPGDRFVIYTDGLTESMTSKGEELGACGFLQILNANKDLDELAKLEDAILLQLSHDFGISSFADDMMILLLELE
jgi:serine phosphatase RsbU (regulator of sigma subunit)